MRLALAALLPLFASGVARASAQGLPEATGASPAVAECPLSGPLTASFDGAMVHVRYLADPALAGREVGSPGERCAADYLAGRFQELGLLPVGGGSPARGAGPAGGFTPSSSARPAAGPTGGSWFHTFPVRQGARLGSGNALDGSAPSADWGPFAFSATRRAATPLVYAGYGVSSPGTPDDAGARVDVRDRVMVVESGDPDAPGRATLRADAHFKARVAAGRGAAALIVLLGPGERAASVEVDDRAPLDIPVAWAAGPLAERLRARALDGHDVTLETDVHPVDVDARNVAALLPGSDLTRAHEYVVVGAHYDHLGAGPAGIHHGADDNASGTAALLEIAARLTAGPRLARPVLFLAFTGEEQGLWGSRHFVERPSVPLADAVAMINLDMVGRLEQDSLAVFGTATAPAWSGILATANATVAEPLDIMELASGDGPSDHASFHAAGIPVLHFFTGLHEDYHRPTDTWNRVDAQGLTRIIDLAAEVVRVLADGVDP